MNDTPSSRERIHDPERLEALKSTGLLDSAPEVAFDRFTRLVGKILNVPVALVSLVDKDRQFFKSYIGLPEPWASKRETPLSHSFCQHVVATTEPLIVADAREHPQLRNNLAVRDLGVVAYLGIPLTSPEQQTLGSFCAIDTKPRQWVKRDIEILTELADSVMTEIEIRILARQLRINFLELRNLEIQRDELVHMLVHDLRNPLQLLTGNLELLEMSLGETNLQREYLTVSRNSLQTLTRMIREILEVRKAEAGRLELQLSNVEPRTIIDAALQQVKLAAQAAEIHLTLEAKSALSTIRLDAEKIVRVLINMLDNAIQHTPVRGQVTVSVRNVEAENAVIFAVADSGEGIPREAFTTIFDKFTQAEIRRFRGTSNGLGLTFCKKVVEQHGGKIWVESELGRGAVFYCKLPRTP